MLTPLSILSLDQGPKWREPEAAPPPEPRPRRGRVWLRTLLEALAAQFGRSGRPAVR